jgi:acyl-CoA thioester hydrolase
MRSFQFTYSVRLDDLDFMAVVGDQQWLIFLQRARIDLLQEMSFSFQDMQKLNIGGAVAENHIHYLRPARFGDVLSVQVVASLCDEVSVKLHYHIYNDKMKECVRSEMRLVFIDGSTGRPAPVPSPVREGLSTSN